MSITQPECVFVALDIQHAMRMRHTVMWPTPLYNIFFHIISGGGKKRVTEYQTCFQFLYNFNL